MRELWMILTQAISKSGCGGLIDNSQHFQTSNLACSQENNTMIDFYCLQERRRTSILCGLTLLIVEISGNLNKDEINQNENQEAIQKIIPLTVMTALVTGLPKKASAVSFIFNNTILPIWEGEYFLSVNRSVTSRRTQTKSLKLTQGLHPHIVAAVSLDQLVRNQLGQI